MKSVKTAVIGCGAISATYIPNLKNLFAIIDLVAVCDVFRESAERRAKEFGVESVMTLEEIEASNEIELVVNLTSPDAHYEVTKRMLLAGKNVFSEKTLASTVEQGKELLELARQKNLYLGVAPDTVLGAEIQTARKVIDAGLIGKPTSCIASISRKQTLNSEIFRFIQRSPAGAFPYDVGVYYIAAFQALLGPIETVTGFAKEAPVHKREILSDADERNEWKIPGYNLLSSALMFESGVLGTVLFDGTSINYKHPHFVIYGTEGILTIEDPLSFDGSVTLTKPGSAPITVPFTHGLNGRQVEGSATTGMGFRGVGAAELAWAMRMGRTARCSAEFGLHTLEVLQGIEKSGLSGSAVNIHSKFGFAPLESGHYDTTFETVRVSAESSLRN